jgi:hypothetical protein
MASITFDAVAKDGTIHIPAQYAGQIKSKVRVILFPTPPEIDGKSERIPFHGFDTTGYRFDRDEANAR